MKQTTTTAYQPEGQRLFNEHLAARSKATPAPNAINGPWLCGECIAMCVETMAKGEGFRRSSLEIENPKADLIDITPKQEFRVKILLIISDSGFFH